MSAEGVVLAEVFVRVACSRRAQWIRHEGSLHLRAEESGVALRVWDALGREGFVHADDIAGREREALADEAVRLMRCASAPLRGLIPRLPAPLDQPSAGFGLEPEGMDEDPRASDRDEDWLRRVEAAAASMAEAGRPGDRAPDVRLREAWLEEGSGRTWIVNSHGLEVSFPFWLGAAGVEIGTGRSTLRYAVPAEGDGAPRPETLIERVLAEASAHDEGRPAPEGTATVVLGPRAAAVWLSAVMRLFIRDDDQPDALHREQVRPARPGFHIVEDAGGLDAKGQAHFDGEGRVVQRRMYVRDGRIHHRITSSRDPVQADELPGPMRRDSYRDRPCPGPMALVIPADGDRGTPLIEDLDRGLLVTSLAPRAAGSGTFLAEARGFWIERRLAPRPVPPTLVRLGHAYGVGTVVARGNDPEPGPPGMRISTPSLMFEKASLTTL